MQAVTSCLGGVTGEQVVTVKSLKMTVTGGSLIVNLTETMTAPDAAAPAQNLSLAGVCTRQ